MWTRALRGATETETLCISRQGEGVTHGLRKVTDDMKTKNRTARTGVISGRPSAAHAIGTSASQSLPIWQCTCKLALFFPFSH